MASSDMTAGAAALYDRVVELFGAHDVHPQDRTRIREALVPGATFETLPADVQRLIVENEGLPAQSWDDPSDVPDDVVD